MGLFHDDAVFYILARRAPRHDGLMGARVFEIVFAVRHQVLEGLLLGLRVRTLSGLGYPSRLGV
jgi:hypothetical protein